MQHEKAIADDWKEGERPLKSGQLPLFLSDVTYTSSWVHQSPSWVHELPSCLHKKKEEGKEVKTKIKKGSTHLCFLSLLRSFWWLPMTDMTWRIARVLCGDRLTFQLCFSRIFRNMKCKASFSKELSVNQKHSRSPFKVCQINCLSVWRIWFRDESSLPSLCRTQKREESWS